MKSLKKQIGCKMLKKSLFSVFLLVSFCSFTFAQTGNTIPGKPIVNGLATYLPKPEYPQDAKDFCADGTVSVEVEIDETGKVISAEAISGDELLRESSVEAVRKAKFRVTNFGGSPIKVKGIVVYNFPREKTCIEKGVINSSALNIPTPQVANLNHPKHLRILKEETVQVLVVVRALTGEVIRARAISGHPMLRSACEYSARTTKFRPTNDITFDLRVKGLIIYKFKPDGTIETDLGDEEKDVIGKPINLVKPPNADCNCKFAKKDNVIVKVKVNEQGNVMKAIAISGHPFLKARCEQAARFSKFSPTKVSGISVKAEAVISYEFVSSGKWTAKLKSITVKSIEAVEK